jgi:hypothetical protein
MPVLMPHLRPVWEGFQLLSSSRRLGMGAGPIPFSEIITYLLWEGLQDKDEQRRWIKFIREMDCIYLEIANKPPEEK